MRPKKLSRKPIPVILDTDIGGDIDDTWAVAMMLKSPELDVRLVVSDTCNSEYRAKILAKLLEVAGRTDIPVGVGVWQDSDVQGQEPWVRDYDLRTYPGTVYQDGVEAIIRTIRESAEPVTLICIGPMPNLRLALSKAPDIAAKTRFVGMHGSIARQHDGKEGAIAEYNVVWDVPACMKAFRAPWKEAIITPLDTCGRIRLKGAKYQKIRKCRDPLVKAVIENYDLWRRGRPDNGMSSILYDTVAIHLAFSTEFLEMRKMKLAVDGQGYTRQDPNGRPFQVAIDWNDLEGYEDFLVERLFAPTVRPA